MTTLIKALHRPAGCSSNKASPPPAAASFPAGSFVNGDWSWEFKPDGTFASSGPVGSETGTYAVTGDRVVIICQCCGAEEGTYSWSFDGKALTFKAIDDGCANRKDVVNASSWVKSLAASRVSHVSYLTASRPAA